MTNLVFPPNPVIQGQTGHISHHNEITTALSGVNSQTVTPSGDTSGVTDSAAVQSTLSTYGTAILAPGVWYGNATITAHENQWVYCQPNVTWNMKTTNIPAFLWTTANPAVYSFTGSGGLLGRPLIVGPSGGTNPSDGSIAVKMGDIAYLVSDFRHQTCQYGLLLENQHFWTEDGDHRVQTYGGATTNPVVLRCATVGSATRTGSFDRTRITVYHNEQIDGNFGQGGVQMLAGAILDGGSIRQYGNFSGTGKANVYSLYISGVTPADVTSVSYSSTAGCEHISALEYDGSGTLPGTVFIDTNCFIEAGSGNLRYINFGPGSVTSFDFDGPITGDTALQAQNDPYATVVSLTPVGWTGNLFFTSVYRANLMFVQAAINVPAAASIPQGTVLSTTVPVPFKPLSNKSIILSLYDNTGGAVTMLPCILQNTGHLVTVNGTTITTGATGGFLSGNQVYSSGF